MNGPQVEHRAHPRSEVGTQVSIMEAAKKAADGRLDPRTRAWAIERIVRAGNPRSIAERAAVLLNALRKERIYIADPTDAEFIPSAACTLDGCEGLTFLGEDCDGLVVAFLAACGSVGIQGALVSHGYAKDSGQLSHVLAAIWDERRWWMADPSTDQPFGQVDAPAREKWVHVPSLSVVCDSTDGSCDIAKIDPKRIRQRPTGDFIGVGAPNDGMMGAAQKIPIEPLDAQALDNARAGLSQRSSEMQDSLDSLKLRHAELQILREEYESRPISEQNVPPPEKVASWTAEDEAYYVGLVSFSEQAILYAQQASRGVRQIGWDPNRQQIVIVGDENDAQLAMDANGNIFILRPDGTQVSVPSAYSGQVGYHPGWYLAIAVIAGLTIYLTADRYVKLQEQKLDYAKQKDLTNLHDRVLAETGDPEKANAAVTNTANAVATAARARAEENKSRKDPFSELADTVRTALYTVVTVGIIGAVGYGIYRFWPAKSHKAKRYTLTEG